MCNKMECFSRMQGVKMQENFQASEECLDTPEMLKKQEFRVQVSLLQKTALSPTVSFSTQTVRLSRRLPGRPFLFLHYPVL